MTNCLLTSHKKGADLCFGDCVTPYLTFYMLIHLLQMAQVGISMVPM